MTDPSSWRKLQDLCRVTTETVFAASHPAYLVIQPVLGDGENHSAQGRAARGFKTALDSSSSYDEEDIGGWEKTLGLLPIVKRAGAIFADRISVGRTRNSDIVIDHPKVSKFHAYFSVSDGCYFVSDGDSTNGTFVSGQRLPANQKTPVQDQCEVRFGTQATIFMLPQSLYRLLHGRKNLP